MNTFLITGGAGFIGSHLAEALCAQGKRVLVVDNLSTGRMENIRHLLGKPNFQFARASITDEIVLDRLASQAEVIIHLAAAVGVKLIVEHPVHTIETNVMGTEAVLKAALRYGCRVLLASTSEVYGKGSKIPFAEDDDVLLGATERSRWAYAASKMVDEFLGLAYHREYGLPVICVRLFNTIGPRQTGQYGMVVPRFVQQALRGEALTVYDDGQQSRCFCDVEDAVRAIMAMAEKQEVAEGVFNIGSREEITILQLAEKVLELVRPASSGLKIQADSIRYVPYAVAYTDGFEDMRRRVPDLSKIHALTGWEPRVSLAQSLERVAEFYRQNGAANSF